MKPLGNFSFLWSQKNVLISFDAWLSVRIHKAS